MSFLALTARPNDATLAAPTGWTLVDSAANGQTILDLWRSLQPTPGTAWALTVAVGRPGSVCIVGYDRETVGVGYGEAASPTAPDVTATEACLVLRVIGGLPDAPVTALTYPAVATLARAQLLTPNAAGTWSAAIGVAHGSQAAAGATGSATWTIPGASLPATMTYAIAGVGTNQAPNAGPDQTVRAFETCTLTATDPDGGTLTWTQAIGPPAVTLAGTGNTRTFTPPPSQAEVVRTFTVTDSGGLSDAVTVTTPAWPDWAYTAGGWKAVRSQTP